MAALEIKWYVLFKIKHFEVLHFFRLMARKNYNGEKKSCHQIEVVDYPLKKLSSLVC